MHCILLNMRICRCMVWKKKNDPIFDILELLSDDKVKEWEAVYNDSTDAYYEEEDDE